MQLTGRRFSAEPKAPCKAGPAAGSDDLPHATPLLSAVIDEGRGNIAPNDLGLPHVPERGFQTVSENARPPVEQPVDVGERRERTALPQTVRRGRQDPALQGRIESRPGQAADNAVGRPAAASFQDLGEGLDGAMYQVEIGKLFRRSAAKVSFCSIAINCDPWASLTRMASVNGPVPGPNSDHNGRLVGVDRGYHPAGQARRTRGNRPNPARGS